MGYTIGYFMVIFHGEALNNHHYVVPCYCELSLYCLGDFLGSINNYGTFNPQVSADTVHPWGQSSADTFWQTLNLNLPISMSHWDAFGIFWDIIIQYNSLTQRRLGNAWFASLGMGWVTSLATKMWMAHGETWGNLWPHDGNFHRVTNISRKHIIWINAWYDLPGFPILWYAVMEILLSDTNSPEMNL